MLKTEVARDGFALRYMQDKKLYILPVQKYLRENIKIDKQYAKC